MMLLRLRVDANFASEDYGTRHSVLVKRGHKDCILALTAMKFITFFHRRQQAIAAGDRFLSDLPAVKLLRPERGELALNNSAQ